MKEKKRKEMLFILPQFLCDSSRRHGSMYYGSEKGTSKKKKLFEQAMYTFIYLKMSNLNARAPKLVSTWSPGFSNATNG